MNAIQLKEIRKKLNLTQAQFAKALDFHLNTIQKWENGDIKMRKNNILAIQNLLNKHIDPVKDLGVNEYDKDIEVLYAEHIAFKNALSIIKDKGVKAYEIHKKTGLNQSGLRRILNEEIDNPQRKTRQVIIDFANSISPEQENVDFRDLKIDDKLNVIYNQIQKLNKGNKAISTMTEDIASNNEMICKIDRSLMVYNLNVQSAIKAAKDEKIKVIKLS